MTTFAFSFIYIVILHTCSKASLPRYYLHQGDFDKLRELIQEVNWDDILSPLNIHFAWKLFVKKFSGFIDECIPQDIPRRKSVFMNCRALNLKTEIINCVKVFMALIRRVLSCYPVITVSI